MKSHLLYEGPSVLDGAPIICVATNPDQSRPNAKTLRVVQTYILRSDISPLDALRSGEDVSICGSCKHRPVAEGKGRSCYVQVQNAPRQVWKSYQRGSYGPGAIGMWDGEIVRLGAYGDPAAVPFWVWSEQLRDAKPLGYTHQWRTCDQRLQRWCMASVDNEAEMVEAKALGWRTFRVRTEDAPVLQGEVICPASAEAGHKTNCQSCLACGGASAKARADITICAHGDRGKVNAFARKVQS